ncbi:enoyl-CoA hydratase/isomerase family protein [Rhodobacteraceae bacterium NNCM2]|nr:enoyl-CoA hydratase/isomerase family protein [Coraliihabitans acroporae]
MAPTTIRYTCEGSVATIMLDQPETLNAFTRTMRREVLEALFTARDEARAIVLTGNGRGFCAGQDLGDLGQPDTVNLERLLAEEYHPVIMAIAESPVPTICAVNGVAAGAGANLALAADVVVAARSAKFIEAFARIGLMPDAGGTYWLPRLVGPARAMGLSLFAEPLAAETAAEWGMIWEVVDDDQLTARTQELAARLATGPTLAFKAMKEALRGSHKNDFDDQLALEARLQGELARSRDFMEGVLAFLEKRKPAFEGR